MEAEREREREIQAEAARDVICQYLEEIGNVNEIRRYQSFLRIAIAAKRVAKEEIPLSDLLTYVDTRLEDLE